MKKISFFTVFVLTVAAAVCACTKENDLSGEVTPREKVISVLHASLEQFGQGTKTYFGTDTARYGGYPVLWEEGDSIRVANYRGGNSIFELCDGAGTMDGVFEKKSGTAIKDTLFYALYPSRYYIEKSGSTFTINFPPVQNYDSERVFAKGAFPEYASAQSLSDKLNFRSMMSILKLCLRSTEEHRLSAITVTTADSGKNLSGQLKFNMTTGEWSTTQSTTQDETFQSVHLECDPPVELSATDSTFFYIVLPHADYDSLMVYIQSYELSGNDTVNCVMMGKIKPNSSHLVANQITKMPTLDVKGGAVSPPHYKEHSYGSTIETDYGPGVLFPGLNVCWAPVNCGIGTNREYPKGLLYQWGRKYGQVLANVQKVEFPAFQDGQDPDNREMFAQFILQGEPTHRWWHESYDPRDEDVWGKSDMSYNPCPEGWRVPTVDEFAALVANVPQIVKTDDVLFKVGSFTLSIPRAGTHLLEGRYSQNVDILLWTSTITNFETAASANYYATGLQGKKLVQGIRWLSFGNSVRCVHDL